MGLFDKSDDDNNKKKNKKIKDRKQKKAGGGSDTMTAGASLSSFSSDPSKEASLYSSKGSLLNSDISIESEREENPYFASISKKYKIARYFTLFLLVAFILIMLTVYKDDITTENFRYMIKYLDINLTDSSDEFASLHYDADNKMDFCTYDTDFVVLSKSRFTIFDQIGNTAVTQTMTFSSPVVMSSDKYVLAYDRGGNEFYVYNGFSQLYKGTSDNPISQAYISDSGSIVVVSSNSSYLAEITVYDRNFTKRRVISKDRYVVAAVLSDDGKYLLVASVGAKEYSQYDGEVAIYDVAGKEKDKEKQLVFSESFTGRVPVGASFTDNGAVVVFSDGIVFYNFLFEKHSIYNFDGEGNPSRYAIDESSCAVLYSLDDIGYKNRVEIIGSDGIKLHSGEILGQVEAMSINNGYCYVVTKDSVIVAGNEDENNIFELSGVKKVVVNSRGIAFACSSNKAVPLRFSPVEEEQ